MLPILVAAGVKCFDNILNPTFLVVTKAFFLGLNYFKFNVMSLQPSKFTQKRLLLSSTSIS